MGLKFPFSKIAHTKTKVLGIPPPSNVGRYYWIILANLSKLLQKGMFYFQTVGTYV